MTAEGAPSAITFLIGTGRCGSTALYRILGEHPDVAFQTGLLNRIPGNIAPHKAALRAWDMPGLGRLVRKRVLPSECYGIWERHMPGFSRPMRDLRADDVTRRKREAFQMLARRLVSPRRRHLMVKLSGWGRVGFIKEIFPEAKIVHIKRDARAFVRSAVNRDWWGGWGGPTQWRWGPLTDHEQRVWSEFDESFLVLAAIQWVRVIRATDESFQALSADARRDVMEIEYAELCRKKEDVIRRVERFVGLRASEHRRRFLEGYATRNMDHKWRRDLTTRQQNDIEGALAALGWRAPEEPTSEPDRERETQTAGHHAHHPAATPSGPSAPMAVRAPVEPPGRRRPDVAIFVPSAEWGGAQRVMGILANEFSRRGFATDVVTSSDAHKIMRESLDPTVTMVGLGGGRVVNMLPGLVSYLRRRRPRSVLATLDHANAAAVAAGILARTDTRVVVRAANMIGRVSSNGSRASTGIMPWVNRVSYHFADGIVAVSKGVADDLAKRLRVPVASVRVINNPVPMAALEERAAEPVDPAWVSDLRVPLIVAAGRLETQKDFGTLIDAIKIVRDQREVRLLIMGEGSQRARLESRIQALGLDDTVSLPGFIPNPYPAMRAADVFVLSSRWEGFPNVLVEAMALGTDVVATDCPSGPHGMLDGGRYGTLVDVGDSAQLGKAILATLDAKTDGSRVRERAAQFSPSTIVPQYTKLLGLT